MAGEGDFANGAKLAEFRPGGESVDVFPTSAKPLQCVIH
jgi:hypothetical protein